jgi:hypothetical protein
MFSRPTVWLIFAALVAATPLCAEEQNAWPVSVRQTRPDGTLEAGQYVGPFFFTKSTATGEMQGFRPFLLQARAGDKESDYFLYPLFTWERQPGFSSFSFFQLINRHRTAETGQPEVRGFDVWPLYFSKETGDPATTYHALLPVAGTIKQRFGKDRLTWYAFPLYFNTDKAGMEITSAPWPFLRFIDGAGHHGFEFWPLYGHRARADDYDKRFWLWPLFYKQSTHLGEPQPTVRIGALPFYTRDTGPGLVSENYVWPFFGYTHRTEPVRYDEQRYFWPFLVQGRGAQRYVNRWAPFYTHSNHKGYDKTWIVWPLYRHGEWQDAGIAQERNQLLFFLYWSQTQRSLTNPAAAPAHKTHVWPLLSVWNNGAGRRQVQFLSPLEVFFPNNEPIRQLYTPFFALYRYDRQSDTASRHALLWNAITYRRSATDREFHLGPLFSVNSGVATKRIALLRGVLGWQRRPGEARGRFFLFDFARKPATPSSATLSP